MNVGKLSMMTIAIIITVNVKKSPNVIVKNVLTKKLTVIGKRM
ncbi:hypothetical protein [Sporosarcina sp. FSL K6-1508]